MVVFGTGMTNRRMQRCLFLLMLVLLAVAAPLRPEATSASAISRLTAFDDADWRRVGMEQWFALIGSEAGGEGVTLQSLVRFTDSRSFNQTEYIVLAGLASHPDGDQAVLKVVWERVPGAFIPVGRLNLEAGSGLSFPAGTSRTPLVAYVPSPGDVLETVLSYSRDLGVVDVLVVNRTSGATVYAGSLQLEGRAGSLYPFVMAAAGDVGTSI